MRYQNINALTPDMNINPYPEFKVEVAYHVFLRLQL